MRPNLGVLQIGIKSQGYREPDFVMSDSKDFTVTYTEAPPSPDYVSGPEYPPLPVYVPYVPEPAYPEFMPLKDDVLPAKEQPLLAAVSPTTDSPGFITESDPKEDPEEDDEDPEEDPADYPMKEMMMMMRRRSPLEKILMTRRRTKTRTRKRGRKVDIFLAISTPPSSPLTSYSSPLPQIQSPPLPVSPPLLVSPSPLPASPTHPLGYRAAMIRLRAESPSTSYPLPIVLPYTRASMAMMRDAAPSTYILASQSETPPSGTPPLLPIPLPTPSLPLLLPSTNCKAGVSEVTLPPRKRLCIDLGLRFEVGESSYAPTARPTRDLRRDYGFVAILDDEIRQDTDEIYGRLDDAQDDRSLMSGQLNLLRTDRCANARTTRLMESEARLSRKAWIQSIDASDTTRSEVRALQTIVLAQQTEIGELRAADRRRQT
ncbi:hypothetical protein Tco_0970384 [Tanacetum coccineum]